MPELRLDEDHHYWLGERQIPGVTSILDAAGLISPFAKNIWAAKRGTVIHQACALLAQGRLDRTSVDDRIQGYVESYEKFLDHTGWVARAVEMRLYDPDLMYAGTFDISFEEDFLIDLKSGAKAKWHAEQLAAYQHLYGENIRRGTLCLQDDGSIAKFHEHKDRNDWKVFSAALTLWHRRNNGSN